MRSGADVAENDFDGMRSPPLQLGRAHQHTVKSGGKRGGIGEVEIAPSRDRNERLDGVDSGFHDSYLATRGEDGLEGFDKPYVHVAELLRTLQKSGLVKI